MNFVTYSRPAAELHLDDRTDHKRLYKTLDTAVPPLPTDTGHDEVFVKSLELAVEELQLRLCEANIDSVQKHDLSLWALRTCLELLRDEYVLCIHRDENPQLYVRSSDEGGFTSYTSDGPELQGTVWDAPGDSTGIRDLARSHSVAFVRARDAPAAGDV